MADPETSLRAFSVVVSEDLSDDQFLNLMNTVAVVVGLIDDGALIHSDDTSAEQLNEYFQENFSTEWED